MPAGRAAALWLVLLAAPGAAPAAQTARGSFEPVGTWHLLVHYRDQSSSHPERLHWDDRIWVFERDGERIRWTEYPIVVFEDPTGRFGRLGTNRQTRIVHAWEPDPGQLRNIREGLEVNPRGSKSKTLRRSGAAGWRSMSRSMAASASIISYQEIWSVEGLPDRPVFTRDDFMGSARSETLEGQTRYAALEVSPDGSEVRGTYERDGLRHGTFRLMRAGAVGGVVGSGKTQSERLREAFMSRAGVDPELAQLLAESGADGPEEAREALRGQLREKLLSGAREQGVDPRVAGPEIERMIDQVMRELDQGRSPEEIEGRIRSGEIGPRSGAGKR